MITPRRYSPIALAGCLGISALAATGGAAHAQFDFTGASSQNWDVAANWTPMAVPGVGNSATITNKSVTKLGGTIGITGLTLSNSSLFFSGNSTLATPVVFTGSSGSSISVDTSAGTVLTIASGTTLTGRISTIAGGTTPQSTSVINNGTITSNATGQTTTISPGLLTNNGTILALNGASLNFSDFSGLAAPVNSGSGTISVAGGGNLTITPGASGQAALTNNGALIQTGGGLNLSINSPLLNGSGTYTFSGVAVAGNATLGGTAHYLFDGTTSGSSTLTLTGGATLGGSGTLASTISVNNTGGTLSPGHSPGTLTIGGAYTQGAGGTMLIEVGGLNAGTDYDVFDVGGKATLGGILDIDFINGFTPTNGEVFNFFNTGSFSGSFSSIVFQNADSDTFSVTNNGTSFALTTISGTAAPEPAAPALLLPALPLIAAGVRRRGRSKAC